MIGIECVQSLISAFTVAILSDVDMPLRLYFKLCAVRLACVPGVEYIHVSFNVVYLNVTVFGVVWYISHVFVPFDQVCVDFPGLCQQIFTEQ